jgi:salicylate hydroxylase
MRRPRIEKVRKTTDFNGFAYHLEWPWTLGRNAVLQLQGPTGHLRRLDWLYGFSATAEAVPPSS